MKFAPIQSYRVTYITTERETSDARRDKVNPSLYHHEAVMVGESENAIISELMKKQAIPLSIKRMKSGLSILNRYSTSYKEQFMTAILFNVSSMSPSQALEMVIQNDTSKHRARLDTGLAVISRGGTFCEAMAAIGLLDQSALAIIEAGERSGTMRHAIKTTIDYLKNTSAILKVMMGMSAMLIFEVFTALSTLIGNRFTMLPRIEQSIPPEATPEKIAEIKHLIQIAYMSNDIMLAISGICLLIVGILVAGYFDEDVRIRNWVDRQLPKIPALGACIQETAVCNSFRIAHSLIQGGVHYINALQIIQKSTSVPTVIQFWVNAERRAQNGESIGNSMKQPLLDSASQLIITAHKNSEQLAEAFQIIAQNADVKAKRAAKQFSFIAFVGTAVYATLAVLITLYVLIVQNENLMSSMQAT